MSFDCGKRYLSLDYDLSIIPVATVVILISTHPFVFPFSPPLSWVFYDGRNLPFHKHLDDERRVYGQILGGLGRPTE
jgi:hypothetical protein